jgi:hypothetical protein
VERRTPHHRSSRIAGQPAVSSSWTFRGSERLCEVRVEAASGGAVLSGCSVGNSLVLTCAHSVDGESPALDSAAVRKCANGSTAAWVPAKSIFENTSLDVALLLDKPLWISTLHRGVPQQGR